mmetsp:Transcript_125468/g.360606  ORF Transcript_125468/g.360606 Transcript_125468/m.360606 type:complete len:296 (+) Transcript_125468:397-1284(+)
MQEHSLELGWIREVKFAPLLGALLLPSRDVQEVLVLQNLPDLQRLLSVGRRQRLVAEVPSQPAPKERHGPKGPSRVSMAPSLRLPTALSLFAFGAIAVPQLCTDTAGAFAAGAPIEKVRRQDRHGIFLCDLLLGARKHRVHAGRDPLIGVQLDANNDPRQHHRAQLVEVEAAERRGRHRRGVQDHQPWKLLRRPTFWSGEPEVHHDDRLFRKLMHGPDELLRHVDDLARGCARVVVHEGTRQPSGVFVQPAVAFFEARMHPSLHQSPHRCLVQRLLPGFRSGVAIDGIPGEFLVA